MAGQEENITTKFKVDISDLKKGITEANKNIKLANAEFKAATAGMDSWATSTEGLGAKLKQLESVLSSEKTKLNSLNQDMQTLSAAEEENKNRADSLRESYQQAANQFGQNSEEAKKYAKALADVEKEQQANAKGVEELKLKILNQTAAVNKTEKEIRHYQSSLSEVEKSMDGLKNKASSLEAEYEQLSRAFGENSEEAKRVKTELNNVKKEISQLENAEKQAEQGTDGLTQGFTVLKGAIASLVADGIKKAVEGLKELALSSDKALNSFQAQTGKSTVEMKKFKKEIMDLYKNNYGESLDDIQDSMARVAQTTKETDPTKIKELTKNAIMLRDTFGMEVPESMRAVNMLMNQFGLDGQQAFGLIAQGAQNGLNQNDDLLDTINEYSVHFKSSGHSAEEMFNVLKNGVDTGVFSVDKLGDAVKEFGVKIKAGDADEYLAQMGLNVNDVKNRFAQGGEVAADAMGEITDAIYSIEDPLKRNEIGVATFGTMFEDLQEESVKALSNVDGSFNKTKNTMDEINKVKYNDVGSQFTEIGRRLQTDFLYPLAELLLPVVKLFASFCINNMPLVALAVGGVTAAISTLAVTTAIQKSVKMFRELELATKATTIATKLSSAATKIATAAQAAFNLVMSANPIALVAIAIAGLVAGIVLLWKKNEGFRKAVIGAWNAIKESAVKVFGWIGDFLTKGLPKAFSAAVKGAKDIGKNIINGILKGLGSGVKAVGDAAKNLGSSIIKSFRKVLKIHSPSKSAEEDAENYGKGGVKGLNKSEKAIGEAAKQLAETLEKNVDLNKNKFQKFCDAITEAFKKQYEEQKEVQLKSIDERQNAEEKAASERIKIYEKEYNKKINLLDNETNARTGALQEQINAIDSQINAEQKAEEEKAYNEKISELEIKLSTAKNYKDREKIKKEIEEAEADRRKKLLDEERNQRKEKLKEQIEEIKEEANKKKEVYQNELDSKKETEEKKLEVIKLANEKEKEETNKKFEKLLSDENIQAEARKLIIEKNNNEILKLLEKYNPNWQNAGQSLSDSLLNGVNSKKQNVQDAIKEAVNLKDIIPEQEKELERLRIELEAFEKLKADAGSKDTADSNNAELESTSANDLGTNTDELNNYAAAVASVDDALGDLSVDADKLAKDTIPKTKKSTGDLVSAIKDGFNGFTDWFKGIFDSLGKNTQEIWKSLKEGFSKSLDSTKEFFDNLGSKINEGLASAGEWFSSIGESIKTAFSDSLNAALNFFVETLPEWFNSIGEQISQGCATIADNVKAFFTETIPSWIENIKNWFAEIPFQIGYMLGETARAFVDLGTNLWNWVTVTLPEILNNMIEWFAGLPSRIGEWLNSVIKNISDWGTNIKEQAISIATEFVNNVVKFFSELPVKIKEKFDDIVRKVSDWGTNIKKQALEIAKSFLDNTMQFFKDLPTKIKEKFDDIVRKVSDWGTNIKNKALEIAGTFFKNIFNKISALPTEFKRWLDNTLSKVTEWGGNLVTKATTAAKNMIKTIQDTLSSLPDKMLDIGRNIIKGLWNGITGAGGWLRDNILGFAKEVISGFKLGFKIHSPSKSMENEVGEFLPSGLWNGISKMSGWLKNNIFGFTKGVINNFGVGFDSSDDITKNLKEKIQGSLTEATAKLKTIINIESSKMNLSAATKSINVRKENLKDNVNKIGDLNIYIDKFVNDNERTVHDFGNELLFDWNRQKLIPR